MELCCEVGHRQGLVRGLRAQNEGRLLHEGNNIIATGSGQCTDAAE
jgi:hypothetical protein